MYVLYYIHNVYIYIYTLQYTRYDLWPLYACLHHCFIHRQPWTIQKPARHPFMYCTEVKTPEQVTWLNSFGGPRPGFHMIYGDWKVK